MTPGATYDRFRSDVVDAVEPYLWSPVEVLGYLHDAQTELCRLTGGIRDATSVATQLDVVIGESWIELHPAVLRVRSATLTSTGIALPVLAYEELSTKYAPTELTLTGPVTALVIGMDDDKLRLVRTPVAVDTITLLVERLPLTSLAVAKPGALPDEFEVREEHHLALLLWMKHLAYLKQDAETFDKDKSDRLGLAFRAYCAKAFDEKQRRNHKPRLIAYGGI